MNELVGLGLFAVASLLIAVVPVYLGARLLRVGNPAWWAALLAVIATLALQDLALKFIDDIELGWLAACLLSGFAFSLMLDTNYWRGLVIGAFVLMVVAGATEWLLDGTPPVEELDRRIAQAQQALWPS
ncbi:hypothetical protein KUW04_11920 [Halomonas denitrificans]|nr:hypothetical protein [Halomonas denitrificans]